MKKIKTVIIPSAGLGSRLFPFTRNNNKLMIPIVTKPIIHYLINEFVNSGMTQIIITGNYLTQIKKYFKKNSRLDHFSMEFGTKKTEILIKSKKSNFRIRYIEQKRPMGWIYELYNLRNILKKEDAFAISFSDIIYDSKTPALKQLINSFNKHKLSIKSNGRFIFKKDIFSIIEKLNYTLGDINKRTEKEFMDQLIKKKNIIELSVKGEAFHVSDKLSYLKTINHFALKNKKISEDYKLYLKKILKTL